MSLWNKLKNFDAYPKTNEDFRKRTLSGAAVSVISGLFILLLFVSELRLYLSVDVQPELFVDTTRGDKLRINFNIIFPKLPCSYLSLDAMDVSGETQLDVLHNIMKQRLDPMGRVISDEKEQDLGSKPTTGAVQQQCGSCFGAESPDFPCCNTCDDVREAYRRKGWAFARPDEIAQCVAEGFTEKLQQQKDEGCRVYGHLEVNKVAGNFHFAPGKSFQQHQMHVHDLHPFTTTEFDVSHKIEQLSFGEHFPGIINPLDGVTKGKDGNGYGMYQYFIKIVPTIYQELDQEVIKTNQFSVTENFRPMDRHVEGGTGGGGGHGLPGVFFMYDLSPIMVKFTEKQRSFAHFLTGVCAIIGGVFTVAGIIDSFIYHSVRSIERKVTMGKHS